MKAVTRRQTTSIQWWRMPRWLDSGFGSTVINSRSGGSWHGPRGDVFSLERCSQWSKNSSVASSRRSRSALVSRSRCRSQGF
ncbi:hypothetical protein M6B38_341265 [Iris pallida]|uniref:Uncharacterized protein n=1 Tax=Iris pallida TaxID=29817 RepID=A0AAX6GY84_IRIPA|nr:hypothetical protein M6B38_341265 [Iris pallida]